jgi:uncharacterized protein (AIM24 family)
MSRNTLRQRLSNNHRTRKSSRHASIESEIVKSNDTFVPDYKIINSPSAGSLVVYLRKDQTVLDKDGNMNYCDGSIKINVNLKKGITGVFNLLTGGDAFENFYSGTTDSPAPICFASDFPGDIIAIKIGTEDKYLFNSESLLCSTVNIEFGHVIRLKNIFGGGDVILKTASLKEGNSGVLWLKTHGGYEKLIVEAGKTMRLDNNLFCAAKDKYKYELTKLGGFKSSLLSGEGMVMKFTGPCEIYIHSRNHAKFVQMIKSMKKKSSLSLDPF